LDDKRLDRVAENYVKVLPLLKLKLLRPTEGIIPENLSAAQFWALVIADTFGDMPVGEIAKDMCVSKNNMTVIIDKLVEEELVSRVTGIEDRRIIKIAVTQKGHELVRRQAGIIQESIRIRLAGLTDSSVQCLGNALESIYSILSVLE
jgi:DNA-binding MarR family transcriptional regulator